jgi:hypothetical protein
LVSRRGRHPGIILVDASVSYVVIVSSQLIANVPVYNLQNEGAMYTAPSPFDDPTAPIDVEALRAWWARQNRDKRVVERRRPERIAFTRQR